MNNTENNIKNPENGKEYNQINTKSRNYLNNNKNQLQENNKLDPETETEKLSQSLKNLLLLDKDFSEPVVVKKENKVFTNFNYATFKNSYGENTCYINVILHLLYNIEQLQEFIISLYEIDESDKFSNISKSYNVNIKVPETNDTNKFLVLIGKILYQYKNIITYDEEEDEPKKQNKKKQVTVINTSRMRNMLEKISNNKFPLNTIADPVEFFSFILDILNENLNEDIHKTFYLELVDEYICEKKCTKIDNKYDKDNFMYHIYIDEILKYIEKENIKVFNFKNKLFEFSHFLFLSENTKTCEKCKGKMEHNLICKNVPDYILINCVWRESNPIVDDAMTIFFMMPLKDEFNNLFICQNKTYKKHFYQLFGFILYSFTLSHYIICIYNIDKDVFVLLNDEIVKEFHNLYELLIDITVDTLETTGKAFFYPVMLIYTKDIIYQRKSMKLNTLNDSEYKNIINMCNEAIYKYEIENKINEEEQSNNYKEFIKEQQKIENEIKRASKYESYRKNKNPDNKLETKTEDKEIKQKINFDEEQKTNNEQKIKSIRDKYITKNNIEKEIENKNILNNNKNIENKSIINNTRNIEDKNIINKNKRELDKKELQNDNIKKGLEKKNITTIGRILKDIKEINGKNISKDIYLGDFIKTGEKINKEINNKTREQNREYNNEIYQNQNINNNRTRTNYLYHSNIIWNNKSNNERKKLSNNINNVGNEIDKHYNKNEENEINKFINSNNTEISSRRRFHRKVNTDMKSNLYGENINNNWNLGFNPDNNIQNTKRYYFNRYGYNQ